MTKPKCSPSAAVAVREKLLPTPAKPLPRGVPESAVKRGLGGEG